MRNVPIAITVVAVIAGVIALTKMTGRGDAIVGPAGIPEATAEPERGSLPPSIRVVAPTPRPYEPVPTLPPPLTREQAIQIGRTEAASMGEDDPILISAMLTTVGDAVARIEPPGGQPEIVASYESRALRSAWLVRMHGSFRPDRGLGSTAGEDGSRTVGWMFVIVEKDTGLTITRGYRPATIPIQP
jgi:hypothetical protein